MSRDTDSPYLFPLLKSGEGTRKPITSISWPCAAFSQQLMLLGKMLGLNDRLSSYAARHTWATTAYCEIHPGIISEAMGHSSITVTETYLKPFRSKKIDEANNQIINFCKTIYYRSRLLITRPLLSNGAKWRCKDGYILENMQTKKIFFLINY